MKRPSLLVGIVFAFIIAVLAAPVWKGFPIFLPFSWTFRLTAVMSYFAYTVYLLLSARARTGAVTLTATNLAISAGLVCFPIANGFVVSVLGLMVTLNRSLLFHRSLISIACDGLVSALGLTFAGYLLSATGSMPAALWGYFLLQAVFVMIPPRFSERTGFLAAGEEETVDSFQHSQRQAEAALQRLIHLSSD